MTVSGVATPYTYSILYGEPGSATPPTDAGTHKVLVQILSGSDVIAEYETSMVISKGTATVTLGSLNHTYDGAVKAATATTVPADLPVNFAYDPVNPVNAGNYTVTATINDSNYTGTASGTLVIAKASATVTLDNLSHTYDGAVKAATATTVPADLPVTFAYDPVNPVNAGNYTVTATISDSNYEGTASGTLVIAKASATVTLDNLSHTYDGAVKAATATTDPTGLTVNFAYDPVNPTNAGSYAVTATISDSNYEGTASGTLVIAKASATVTLDNLSHIYDGSVKAATATTVPADLPVTFAYDPVNPTNAGSYAVTATINDSNYTGTASDTLVIAKATATVTLSNLAQTYDGNPKPVTVTTTPTGLNVVVTYNDSSTVPSAIGSYAVFATVNDTNYTGSASDTLVISGISHSIDLLEGWNLISFNIHPTSTAVEDVLESVAGKYRLVYGWDASSDSSNWMRFDPALGFGNTLTEINESMGFWIYMEVPSTLTVLGTTPTNSEITLYEGWNLIGWPTDASADLPAALAEIASNYDLVMAYHANDTADPWKLFDPKAADFANDLMEMAPGWGYWIKMTAADNLPIGQ